MELSAPIIEHSSDKPLNLGLNDGTYMPQACVEVLRRLDSRTALRNFPSEDNSRLLDALARQNDVTPDHIFLHHGSGPILKQVMPQLIRKQIKASPKRILRHLVNKTGYPIITPQFTYSKVPVKAAGLGLLVRPLPLGPANGFQLDPALIEAALERQDGLVYLPSPNNPTGTMMIGRDDLVPLLRRFPESRFWIDEAYVQYVEPNGQGYLADLVPQHPNLFVSRSFSFAYGLAAIRVGYLVGAPDIVKEMRGQLVEYYIGRLQEDLVVAALNDEHHLPFIRRECRKQAKLLRAALDQLPGIETYPTLTNFILCRLTDGRKAKDVAAAVAERGIRIKAYEPIGEGNEGEYFRVTLGIAEENSFLQATLRDVLGNGA